MKNCLFLFFFSLFFISIYCELSIHNKINNLEELLHNNRADGDACLVCQFGLAIIEENMEQNIDFWENFLLQLCDLLPNILEQQACKVAVNTVGAEIILQLLETYNPDYVCGPSILNVCEQCSIDYIKTPSSNDELFALNLRSRIISNLISSSLIDVPESVLPELDNDGDLFSPVDNLRRTAKWRGKDCDDTTSSIHPGFMDIPDGSIDNNCNGIYGTDPATGNTFENDYCSGSVAFSSRKSIVMFGDSAAAAFRIPVEWLNLQNLTTIPQTAIQELDFPHMSWSTGYDKIGNDSIYLYMREKNLCNHLDFQNLAKNGAVMEDLAGYQVASMTPSDYPLLAFIAYIGNDVCDSELADMTTPSEFRTQAINGLNMLNDVAVPGSKVVLLGLVDGRILWDTLYNREHPLGMTYENFYNFLTCTGANPCFTWLNSNEAIRNATSLRAYELSEELRAIVSNDTLTSTWSNLELIYLPFPVEQILNFITLRGQDPASVIEPVDGFHPSQYAHRLSAKVLWDWINILYPNFFGKTNPNNSLIESKFPNPPPY